MFKHKLHGDGIHDDTAAIQERIDAFTKGIPPFGTYLVTSNIILPKDTVVVRTDHSTGTAKP